MDIVRNDDGTLVVPVPPERTPAAGDPASGDDADGEVDRRAARPATRLLRPGEGGYDER